MVLKVLTEQKPERSEEAAWGFRNQNSREISKCKVQRQDSACLVAFRKKQEGRGGTVDEPGCVLSSLQISSLNGNSRAPRLLSDEPPRRAGIMPLCPVPLACGQPWGTGTQRACCSSVSSLPLCCAQKFQRDAPLRGLTQAKWHHDDEERKWTLSRGKRRHAQGRGWP